MKTRLLIVALCLICMSGCIKTATDDGETYSLDEKAAAKIEAPAEAAVSIMAILSAFYPVLIPVTTAGGAAIATWLKIKPQLTTARTEAELYYDTTAAIVEAIEAWKENDPDDWAALEERLKKAIGPNALNVIRGLRGLCLIN